MTYKIYTQVQLDFVKAHKHLPAPELTQTFNATFGTTRTQSGINGLRKRKSWKTGNDGRFKKGHLSTKGKKLINGGSSTSFKKGLIPHNHAPVGTERLSSKDKFIKIKIAEPNKWAFKHRVIWEAVHGSVPKNHCLIFIDSNRNNCVLENLELITRAEMLRMNQNQYRTAPKEIKPAIKTLSKLEVRTFEKQNRRKSCQNQH